MHIILCEYLWQNFLRDYCLKVVPTRICVKVFATRPVAISRLKIQVEMVGWVLEHINLCRLFNAKSIFIQINSSISNNSV